MVRYRSAGESRNTLPEGHALHVRTRKTHSAYVLIALVPFDHPHRFVVTKPVARNCFSIVCS